jgi:hypothetical protein
LKRAKTTIGTSFGLPRNVGGAKMRQEDFRIIFLLQVFVDWGSVHQKNDFL